MLRCKVLKERLTCLDEDIVALEGGRNYCTLVRSKRSLSENSTEREVDIGIKFSTHAICRHQSSLLKARKTIHKREGQRKTEFNV